MRPPASADPSATPGDSDDGRREGVREVIQRPGAFHVHTAVLAAGVVAIFLMNRSTDIAAEITGEWSTWWSGWALIVWSLAAAEAVACRKDQATAEATAMQATPVGVRCAERGRV
jgi:hypothetical protein